jgi:glucan phosphoethanolaminetransferase (alkaline phosphatase superfamily)
MEQDVIFSTRPWLPVLLYYAGSLVIFVILFLFRKWVVVISTEFTRLAFIFIVTLACAIQIIIGYYDVVGFQGYGYDFLNQWHVADYDTIRYGVIVFVPLYGMLLRRLQV